MRIPSAETEHDQLIAFAALRLSILKVSRLFVLINGMQHANATGNIGPPLVIFSDIWMIGSVNLRLSANLISESSWA